jgi:hypothetical protein
MLPKVIIEGLLVLHHLHDHLILTIHF